MEFTPLSDAVDLEGLDRYLLSDNGPDDGMGLSDLDGFLTGLAAGPETIPPSEWLPLIWGGEEPRFDDEDEMRMVFGTILGRYNEIAALLDTDPEQFAPIYWENTDGSPIVTDWAVGFLEALALRPEAWEPLINDPEAHVALVPLLLCGRDVDVAEEIEEWFDEETFVAELPDMLPVCVFRIHKFWQNRNRPGPPRRTRAAGRSRSGRRRRR